MIGTVNEVPERSATYLRRDNDRLELPMCPYSNYYPCSVEGCEKARFVHGLCGMHARRMRVHGTLDDPPARSSWAVGNQYNVKHGHIVGGQRTPTYKSWQAMRSRCTLPKHPAYARYGGRGITICERWNDFANFLADMGERPEGMTLDRTDNDGNYEPSNCRWVTPKQQAANRGRKGRTQNLL